MPGVSSLNEYDGQMRLLEVSHKHNNYVQDGQSEQWYYVQKVHRCLWPC